MLNILIIYEYFPKRTTIIDHLYCFRRYSGHRCFYLNMALQSIPTFVKTFPWDLIIFHTVFLSSRWTREIFLKHQEKLEFVKNSDAVKICLPQDEFINMDLVCDFINKLKIDHVFSVAAENQWPIIYKKVDFNKVKFSRVLTGYIDGSTAARIHRIIKNCEENRPIDVGYRANHSEFWLGCHGAIKWQIGELFKDKASKLKIALDISTDPKDTIFGDDWYRFLARCKYQLGVEGGASILDWDGTYRKRTEAYLAAHRGALLKEVEEKCFPDAEGSLDLRAISPRHFESCLTRTCQILIEGDYNGILVPGKHYIVLKRDFSNIEQVLNIISKDELRTELVQNAWHDVVESGKYTYENFVRNLILESLSNKSVPKRKISRVRLWFVFYSMYVSETIAFMIMDSSLLRLPLVMNFGKFVRKIFYR